VPQQFVSALDAGGTLVAGLRLGPYEVKARLGAGGMGEVYRALDTRLGREVALKVLSRSASTDSGRRLRFDREARLASAVSHPHVLMVLDVGEWEGLPYVVTELLEGETLRTHLRPGGLAAREAVNLAVQVARGLAALHASGIVHRDLKPENLFVTTDGRIKILDLGLATPSREGADSAAPPWDTLTTEGAAALGTAAYMAPEQVRRMPAGPRADIFACGVVLYEMLGRRRPFQEETAAETMTAILRRDPVPLETLEPSLPPTLVRVVERCLAKRPDDRFHSAHDLALALEAAFDSGAAPSEKTRRALRERRESPGRGAALWLALALLASAAGWLWWQNPAGSVAAPVLPAGPAVLVRYDPRQGEFTPFLQGIAADGVDFSRDAKWATFTSYPEGVLWRSRLDGSERLPLTKPPLRAGLPRFSPDGRRIAFSARIGDAPWQIRVVSRDGGDEQVLPPLGVTDPGWEPDGKTLVFGSLSGGQAGIVRWDLVSGGASQVPGSDALFSPRPSPDGRFLAAIHKAGNQLAVLEVPNGQWRDLTTDAATYPAWSRDGASLSFRRTGPNAGFYRVDPRTRREERVTSIDEWAMASSSEWGAWSGATPDGEPLMLFDLRGRVASTRVASARVRAMP
jgi:hypothetical protein